MPGTSIRLAFGVGIVAVGLGAGGCSSTWWNEPPCMPPAFSVSPGTAGPGETVVVSADNATCNPRYGADALAQITVTDQSGRLIVDTTTDMSDAGRFSYSFDVPAQVPPGPAQVTAMPYDIDWCDDTGTNNRVAGNGKTIERVSCAEPVKPLIITD